MTTQVEKLIERSYKVAGLYQQDRILTGSKQQEALTILNEFLDYLASNPSSIAFYNTLQFPVTSAQQSYILAPSGGDVVSNRIIELKFVVLISSGTRYPVKIAQDYEYYSQIYYQTSGARPYACFLQNNVDSSTINFIYKPDTSYTCEIKAKFVLDSLALSTDISNVPEYYIRFLKYSLAKELAIEYMPSNWTQAHETELTKITAAISNISDVDMSLRVNPIFTSGGRWWDHRLGVVI